MASNGVRYGLPGAGIALAAKGIGDVAFGGPSDQQEPAQINMGQVAGFSALGSGLAAAPALYDRVRDPKFRSPTGPMGGRGVAGLAAAGAVAGGAVNALGQALF